MDRNLGLRVLSFLALAALAPPARAMKEVCTGTDKASLAAREKRATAALEKGDVRKWAEVMKTEIPTLSPACRKQQARVSPATDRCTREEKLLALEKQQQSIAADLDVEMAIVAIKELWYAVSPACWLALGYPQDRDLQTYCSDEDLLELARLNSLWPADAHWAILDARGEEPGPAEPKKEPLLSPLCQGVVSRLRAGRPSSARPVGGTPLTPERAPDLPRGTFVVPGVGACTPKECTVL